jgi:DNA (cytosine-5)-methyltransferase 1
LSLSTYGSLFTGVGGIDLGFDLVGLQCCFQIEIEKNCLQTLQYHWPNVKKMGDITNVKGHELPQVDIISFGSPCQDLSTAGDKTGLKGESSKIFYEAIRIIKEMRQATNGQYPKWSLWENVTGALSSNRGADFGQVLHEMDEAGACFSEWAVLDARYFGVPQRRRRVYLLSVFDPAIAARCPSKILPIKQGSTGDSKEDSKGKKGDSTEFASCLRSGGKGGLPSSRGENLVCTDYPDYSVRRFTPIECERLMGWPDNHTLYRADGKKNSDNNRYKMCGNGVASPVIKWIAEKIINI